MAAPPEPERFYTNLIGLCDYIQAIVSKAHDAKETNIHPNIVYLGKQIIKGISKDQKRGINYLIHVFIDRTYEFWENIHDNDENFLYSQLGSIFNLDKLGPEASEWATILSSSSISPEDRQVLWEHLHALVKICIKHIHKMRVPSADGKRYTETYIPEIKIGTFKQLYGVQF